MIVSDTAVKNSVAVVVLAVLILVFGTYCYLALPRENEPDITIPNVFVSTNYRGVSSVDMETAVTVEIEKKLKGLDGLKKIQSVSSEGMSNINIEFVTGTDIDQALQDVKDKVDEAMGELPDDLDEDPSVFEVNFSELPIVVFSLSGTCGLPCLKKIADDLEDEIEAIPGVLAVDVTGGLEREIRVEVFPEKLAYYGLTINSLENVLTSENKNTSGGAIRLGSGRFLLRVPGEFATPEEIYGLVVKTHNGEPVYLKDVARVVDGFKEEVSRSRLNVQAGGQYCGAQALRRKDHRHHRRSGPPHRRRSPDLARGHGNHQGHGQGQGYPIDGGGPGKQYPHRPGPGGAGPVLCHGAAQCHHGQPGHPLFHAALLYGPVCHGHHPEHGGAVQPDPGPGHAGGQRHRHRRKYLPFHGTGGVPGRGGHEGHRRGGLAGDRLHPDHPGRLCPHALLAGDHGRIHELSAPDPDHHPDLQPLRGPGDQPGPGLPVHKIKDKKGRRRRGSAGQSGRPPHRTPGTNPGAGPAPLPQDPDLLPRGSPWFSSAAPWSCCSSWCRAGCWRWAWKNRWSSSRRSTPRGCTSTSILRKGRISTTSTASCSGWKWRWPAGPKSRAASTDASPETYRQALAPKPYTTATDRDYSGPSDLENITDIYMQGVVTAGPGSAFDPNTPSHIGVRFLDLEERHSSTKDTVAEIRERVAEHPRRQDHRGHAGGGASHRRAHQYRDLRRQLQRPGRDCPPDQGESSPRCPMSRTSGTTSRKARPRCRCVIDRQKAALFGLSTDMIGFALKTAYNGLDVSSYREGNDDYDITVQLPESDRKVVDVLNELMIPAPSGEQVPLSTLARVRFAGSIGDITRINNERVVTVKANVDEDQNSRPGGPGPGGRDVWRSSPCRPATTSSSPASSSSSRSPRIF